MPYKTFIIIIVTLIIALSVSFSFAQQADPQVKQIQQALEQAGFNPGKVNGIISSRTRSARRQYQSKNELHKSQILEVQEILKKAGFNPGMIDGLFGIRTCMAILQYQNQI